VERLSGREAISEPFRFEIDCISTDAFFDLKSLLGAEITLRLLLADGSKRAWHGYESYQPICLAYAYSVSSPSWKNDGGVNAPVSLKPCQNAMSSNIRKILN